MAWIRNQDGNVLVDTRIVMITKDRTAISAYDGDDEIVLGTFTRKGTIAEFNKICDWVSNGSSRIYRMPDFY